MEGAARAANRKADANTVLAYQCLQFYGLAMNGKLKGLSEYLIEKPKRKRAQTPDEMFAALQMFKAGGAPMNIRQIN
jgi:hypothetical protein